MQVIKVFHKEDGKLVHVANVKNSKYDGQSEALEYAYFRTQNIAGSWSQTKDFQGEPGAPENYDYSPDTEVVAPLHKANGKVYGLRSSMVGDVFEIEGEQFVVASSGFKPYQPAEAA